MVRWWPVPGWTLHPAINTAQVGGGFYSQCPECWPQCHQAEEKQTLNSTSSQWMKQFSLAESRPGRKTGCSPSRNTKKSELPGPATRCSPLAAADSWLLCRGPVSGPEWPLSSPHLTILCSENADKSNNGRAVGPTDYGLFSAHHPHKT